MATVTSENLGAWVFKCNPEVWDLAAFMADGNDWIDDWSVVDNYRSAMMQRGQRALLWVTGNEQKLARGFWGSGWISGPVDRAVLDDEDGDEESGEVADPGYWLDEDYRLKTRLFASLDLPLWDAPVKAVEVSALVPDLEILAQPQMSNPSWVSAEQLQRLLPLLPDWPEPEGPSEVIVVDDQGARAGDPITNLVVERVALRVVEEDYAARSWQVEDVSDQKIGWDLTCRRGADVEFVEVKGRSGRTPVVLLTRKELNAAREHDAWRLAVVTDALHKPVLTIHDAAPVLARAEPYVSQVDLSPSPS